MGIRVSRLEIGRAVLSAVLVAAVLLSVVLLSVVLVAGCGPAAPPEAPPTPVVTAAATERDVRVVREFVGTTEGNVDAEIRAQVSGYLLSRDYREGSLVDPGQLLFQIDARPFQATLEQARGELERARAAHAKAEQDVARFTPLAAEGAVSQQELDNALQAARAGKAAVEAGQAVVDKARVELGFTKITSPIEGIVGVALAQIGDLVGPTRSEPLTSVSQVDPIRVSIPISEREYLRFAQQISAGLRAETTRSENPLQLVLADGNVYPYEGYLTVTGREVDQRTGTILLKAEFPNADMILRPGQYVRVRAAIETLKQALVVPQRAVGDLQGTHQVAVVGEGDVVEMRVVELGPQDGNDVVVQKGLAVDDRVVVEGLQKIRSGVKVAPAPAGAGGVEAPTQAPAPGG